MKKFKAYDKIIVKDDIDGATWFASLYSHSYVFYDSVTKKNIEYVVTISGESYRFCLLFIGNEFLLGTVDDLE